MKLRLGGLTALAAVLITGLAGGAPARAATSGEPYKIDVMLSLTGSFSFLGTTQVKDITIEQGVINAGNGIHGRPVQFVFHDDQSSPQLAVQLLGQLAADHPKIIVGTNSVAACNAMAPLLKDNGPVVYCLSPGVHPPKGSYLFSTNVSTSDLFTAILRYYRLRGWTHVAILTSSDASGQDAARGLKAQFAADENKDMVLVDAERFNPTDVSADAQIQSMKAAHPQAIITWTSGTPLGTVLRGVANAGWDVPVATTDANMLYKQMAQYKGFTPKQFFIPGPTWETLDTKIDSSAGVHDAKVAMYDAFKAAGDRPDMAASLSWDPVMLAVTALNALPDDATPAQVRDYLGSLQGYTGTTGVYDMQAVPQRGLGLKDVVVTHWQADPGKFVVVSQAGGAPL